MSGDGRDVVQALLAYVNAGVGPEDACADLGLVLGWRLWRAASDRLESFVFDTAWPQHRPMRAECPLRSHTAQTIGGGTGIEPAGELAGITLHEDHEHAPAFACRCGIYAALQRADLPTTSADRRWIGPVALWGTVIEHRFGYRASHAYPLALEEVAPSSVLDGIREVTVLFVEADAVIRDLGVAMLRRRGCRVFAAANCGEARRVFRQHTLDIDIMIAGTAAGRPDIHALVEYAETARPEVAVVANSGRFLVASLDGRAAGVAGPASETADPFAHALARAYGIPVVVRNH